MATIVQNDGRRDGNASTALTAIVAIIGILLVSGIALYTFRVYPFNAGQATDSSSAPSVDVDVNGSVPVIPGY